jgi:DNA-directed RNA polymerase specialized sigma24 family protein
MHRRKQKKQVSSFIFLKYETAETHNYSSKEQLEQKSKAIQQSISNLAPACQKILRLKMSGASYKEIANEYSLSKTKSSTKTSFFAILVKN